MKTLLAVFGAIFLLVVVACGGLVMFAKSSTSDAAAELFTLVGSNDASKMLAACSPELQEEIDEPVLQAWMNAINESLGEYESVDLNGMNYNSSYNNGKQETSVSGVANFANGTATFSFNKTDGKITAFKIDSDQLPKDWFKGPADTSLYQQRAEDFLTLLTEGKAEEAYAQMHEALKKLKSVDALQEEVAMVKDWAGPIKEVRATSDEFDDSADQVLRVGVEIEGEAATLPAYVNFQFVGLRGHILGYGVTSPNEQPAEATPAAQ